MIVDTKHVVDYLPTHWEFFLLLPVLADRRRLGAASVHSVVRVVICDERSQVICNATLLLSPLSPVYNR